MNSYDINNTVQCNTKLALLRLEICYDNLTLAKKTQPVLIMLYNKVLLHCQMLQWQLCANNLFSQTFSKSFISLNHSS